MPLTERNPDAVSLNYAKALIELAMAKGGKAGVEDIQGELEDLLELTRADKQFSEFLATRSIASKKRRDALERMLRGRVSDLLLNFLHGLQSGIDAQTLLEALAEGTSIPAPPVKKRGRKKKVKDPVEA